MKMKILNTNKINNFKNSGFTMGLALVIVASVLLISVSISTLLIRDLKNSAANEKSAIAYSLAESALECIISYENNIRYFDTLGNNITGLFPASLNYLNSALSYANNELPVVSATQEGYAYRDYQVDGATNKFLAKKDIRCFGNEILSNINIIPSNESDVETTLNSLTPTLNAPAGYYSSNSALNGVVTYIRIKTDINYDNINQVTPQKLFGEYLQKSCVDINIYAAPEGDSYKKLISAEASVPCNAKSATKRVLVRYIQ